MAESTDKQITNILDTIMEIRAECESRNGYPPKKVFYNSVMRNRIVAAICERYEAEFKRTRQKAVEGVKLLGMSFIIDNRVPDDELHFCTKQRQLIVRVKVDIQPAADAA